MTGGTFAIDGIPGVRFLDVAAPGLADDVVSERLEQLIAVHLSFFPEYDYVEQEWRTGISAGWPDPEVVVHLWLALVDGEPVGEVILHTNLRRGVVMIHFVAMTVEARYRLPRAWLVALSDAFVTTGETDARRAGRPLRGVMGEIPLAHLRKWEASGFQAVAAVYAEPVHGGHWVDYGPPQLHELVPIVRVVDAGRDESFAEVADAAFRGFLIDYYELPLDHPKVVRMLGEAAADHQSAVATMKA